ncbi:MAG TPA: 2-oxoacid:acceptor oxidoreductase subunit alpha [Bacteroidota bacterium]|nr:2-oxoacid:acceptor oxidoreductase subunit alpha [Bacteroidota bacterium]
MEQKNLNRAIIEKDSIIVRFAGDSGDGMQLTGTQFTATTAFIGNDVVTLPDYPAEIRAPAGTLYGVSGFQLHFSSKDILTPGDSPDVLIALNPAALKINLKYLKKDAIIIVNSDAFDSKNLSLANYETNPLEDGSLDGYRVYDVPITKATLQAVEGLGLSIKEANRCKNFFALGLSYWLFNRPMDQTIEWIKDKFSKDERFVKANIAALKAGYFFGDTTEIFTVRFEVKPAKLEKGKYRSLSGNEATAWGLLAASVKSGLPLFLGSYPITPASDILHELSRFRNFGVMTFQAEDEIAGISTAIGASFGGNLAATTTSGPGVALKQEAIGLAIMTELPLVICNIQRGGPSTGLPTKTEQSDLFQAIWGRNGEAPLPVLAPATPSECFDYVYEAARLAIKYMTPVMFLSDGYLANGSEPWLIQNLEDLPDIPVKFRTEKEGFAPYIRDENLARPWVKPGTPGLEHRIGGLEKQHITGNVSYDPDNHQFMVNMRNDKVNKIADEIPLQTVYGNPDSDIVVVGWGSTFGPIYTAVEKMNKEGIKVAGIHVRYLNPMPKNLGELLRKYKKILIPEMNLGQLRMILQAKYLIETIGFSKVKGVPFTSEEIELKIKEILKGN